MSSSDSEEVQTSAPSNAPLASDKDNGSSGDPNDAGNNADIQDDLDDVLDKDNTGKEVTPEEQKAREGKLRAKYGEERKLLLTQMRDNAPDALKAILEANEDLARSAAKFGITPEALSSNAQSPSRTIPEEFVANATERNLNEAEAKKAWELAESLAQSGLSEELAQKTALEQVSSAPEVPPSIPTGGSAVSGNEMPSGKVDVQTFSNWDDDRRRAYREKHGNKFLE